MKFSINCEIREREIRPDDRAKWHHILKTLNGKDVRLEFKEVLKPRSLNQNSYYWGVIIKTFQEGYYLENNEHIDASEAHEVLKANCNYKEIIKDTGEVLKVPLSTTDLGTMEFEIYAQKCRDFIKYWFYIDTPLPNEHFEEMK